MSNMSVSFNNVGFSYNEKPVLENINILINENGIYIIKGQNGAGKSTLVKLLSGIYNDYTGEIIVDGVNIKNLDKVELRNLIFLNSQKTPIFDDTLMNNIFLGKQPNDFEKTMYKKLISDYDINDIDSCSNINDNSVSGGQAQKIGIVRTILSNRGILIFDEPTSNLDKISVKNFINTLQSLEYKYIIIIITHDNVFDYLNYQEIFI
ncbi:MAG: ABC transporter ATP-binding protein [Longicatena sp.]